jgi:hypothetical protein
MNDPGCEPVFIISVAARLLEMHPQTLRKYEREGLIAPSRTTGNLRLYSDEDLARLRQVNADDAAWSRRARVRATPLVSNLPRSHAARLLAYCLRRRQVG